MNESQTNDGHVRSDAIRNGRYWNCRVCGTEFPETDFRRTIGLCHSCVFDDRVRLVVPTPSYSFRKGNT